MQAKIRTLAPQTWDLLEKLALIFLYDFHHDHISLKLKIKKLSPKINVKNIKPELSGARNLRFGPSVCLCE